MAKSTTIRPVADCGCVYHAEQGILCPHDIALSGGSNDPRDEVDPRDQAEFDADLGFFFELLWGSVDTGKMTLGQLGEYFPDEVRNRSRKPE